MVVMPPKRKKPTFDLRKIVANVQKKPYKRRKMEQQKKAQKEKANERLVEDFGRQGAKRVMNKTAAATKIQASVEDSSRGAGSKKTS